MDQERSTPKEEPTTGISRLTAFFKDPSQPLIKRLTLPLGLVALLILWIFSPSEAPPDLQMTPEDFMGSSEGGSGLGEEASKAERLIAQMPNDPRSSKFDIKDLGLDPLSAPLSEKDQLIRERELRAEAEDAQDARTIREDASSPDTAKTPFTTYPELSLNPLDIAISSKGAVYVADKASLVRFSPDLSSQEKLLDAQLYDREFNEEMATISTVHVDEEERVWLGFFQGQVARYHRYAWRMMLRAGEPMRGRVFAITSHADSTFIAGKGLWRWDEGYQRAISAANLQERRFSKLIRNKDKQLFAAGFSGVWRYQDSERIWESIWTPRREDGGVHTMIERSDGRLLVGTSNGIVEISTRGVVTDRLLVGEVVSGIIETSSRNLFVSTRQHGLFHWDGASWYRVAKEQGLAKRIDEIKLDTRKRLWIAASRDGLFMAPLDELRAWMKDFPEEIAGKKLKEPKTFSTACDAAREILDGITLSRNIAVEVLDGVAYVFFDGVQVCPSGFGYRRPDGTVVLQQGWSLTVYKERAREVIEIPKEYAADQNTALLLDSKDRIWIGTSEFGLYRYDKDEWQHFTQQPRLSNNRIKKIIEDSRGRIWIASNPQFDKEEKKFLGVPINFMETKSDGTEAWFSIGPTQGLGAWAVNDLIELQEESFFIATSKGYSVLRERKQILNFGSRESIDPNYTHSAAIDGLNHIWLAHQFFGDGISVFDGSTVRHISEKAGLFSSRIVDIAHDRQGRVWLMAASGQVGVYPRAHLLKLGKTSTIPKRKQVTLRE